MGGSGHAGPPWRKHDGPRKARVGMKEEFTFMGMRVQIMGEDSLLIPMAEDQASEPEDDTRQVSSCLSHSRRTLGGTQAEGFSSRDSSPRWSDQLLFPCISSSL